MEVEAKMEELCRLCGAQDDKMLHMADTFSILGATSSIFHLLNSISIYLKVQGECEDAMPKHLCFSCFNTSIDIQAFIDSGINFQKTTISQLFPGARVQEEAFTAPMPSGSSPRKEICDGSSDGSGQLLNNTSQQAFSYLDISKDSTSCLHKTNSHDCNSETHNNDWIIEQNVNNRRHIIDSYQDTVGIFEEGESSSSHGKQQLVPSDGDTKPDQCSSSHGKQQLAPPDGNDKPGECSSSHSEEHFSHNLKCIPVKGTVTQSNTGTPDSKKKYHKENKSKNKKEAVKPSSPAVSEDESSKGDRKCPVCNKKFSRQSQLKGHMTSHSKARPFECEVCFMRFKYRRNLVEHSHIHHADPAFICSSCGLRFKQKSNLLKHERSHRGKGQYRCSVCSKEFSQSSHLNTHIKNSHGEHTGYRCEQCEVVVRCQSSLRRHMSTVHALTAKFTCPYCSKTFNNIQNYQGHLRGHTGERPFCCPHCNKSFTTSKALSRHRATHQGIRHHKCMQCGKAFLEHCDLKRHIKRHKLRRVKKKNSCKAVSEKPASTPTTTTTQDTVEPSINSSISLMVLTDSLSLFTQPPPLLEGAAHGKATQVLLPHEKLNDEANMLTTSPGGTPSNMAGSDRTTNLQPAPLTLSKTLLRPHHSRVLTASELMATPSDLTTATSVLEASEVMASLTSSTSIHPSQMLQPTSLDLPHCPHQVSLNPQQGTATAACCPVSEAPTMVVLSSAQTPTAAEFLSISRPPSPPATSNVLGEGRQQQSERVLSHSTW